NPVYLSGIHSDEYVAVTLCLDQPGQGRQRLFMPLHVHLRKATVRRQIPPAAIQNKTDVRTHSNFHRFLRIGVPITLAQQAAAEVARKGQLVVDLALRVREHFRDEDLATFKRRILLAPAAVVIGVIGGETESAYHNSDPQFLTS